MSRLPSLRKSLGEFFANARVQAGLTIEEAARHLDLADPEHLVLIEEGKKAAHLNFIYALTNIYNINPEDLYAIILDLTRLDFRVNGDVLEQMLEREVVNE